MRVCLGSAKNSTEEGPWHTEAWVPQFPHLHPSACRPPLLPHLHWPQFEDIPGPLKAPPGPCHPLQPLSHHAFPNGLGSKTLEHSVLWCSRAF